MAAGEGSVALMDELATCYDVVLRIQLQARYLQTVSSFSMPFHMSRGGGIFDGS